jgi:hypothetical protein
MDRLVIISVSTAIYLVIWGISVASSGASARVHAVDAAGLFAAFWIPAQFVTRPEVLRLQWRLVLACILGGTFLWDVLSALVIAKRELFMGAIVVYPGAIAVLTTALLCHSMLTLALRNGLTNR